MQQITDKQLNTQPCVIGFDPWISHTVMLGNGHANASVSNYQNY